MKVIDVGAPSFWYRPNEAQRSVGVVEKPALDVERRVLS